MGKQYKGHFCGSGYVTVVFSMIFLTVISVVLSALEAVRVSAVRLQAETACAIACEAFLSQYQPQVQARYGLYLVERDGFDTTFLQQFIKANCGEDTDRADSGAGWLNPILESAVIDQQTGIRDEDFRYLEDQIFDLMIVLKGSDYAERIRDSLMGTSMADVEAEKQQMTSKLEQEGTLAQQQKEAAQRAADENEGGNSEPESPEDSSAGEPVDDPRENLSQMLKYPILSLIMDGRLSDAVLDTASLSDLTAPEENVSAPKGFMDYTDVTQELKKQSLDIKSAAGSAAKSLVADAYILDFLSNGAKPQKKGQAGVLSYETEYILSGQDSDAANLQNTVNRIMLIRMILNMTYLLKSTAKTAAVHAAAAALASAILMPFLEEIIYLLILAAWAYGEALVDCRSLLNGGKVPLMKSDATWVLSLEQLTKLSVSQLSGYAGKDDDAQGMCYEDYLRILLLGVSKEKKYVRLMNIIEANTRLLDGCESFRMDQCVFGISVCADFIFYPVFFHNAGKDRYEHHVHMSIAY